MIPLNCGALPDFRLNAPVEARIPVKLVHMKSNEIASSMKARGETGKCKENGQRGRVSPSLSIRLRKGKSIRGELDRLIAISWSKKRELINECFFFFFSVGNHNVLLRFARGMRARASLRLRITWNLSGI